MPSAAIGAVDSPRREMALVDGWRFHRGPVETASAVGFIDPAWEAVTLPHTWNAQDGQDGGADYFRGDGWYRRRFRVDIEWAGKRVFLQFDGANRSAEDPFRLSTYASNGNVSERRAGYPDVIAFNHYFGWYRGEVEDFAPWLDQQHSLRPDLGIGMSEFGAGANVTQHEENPRKPAPAGPWHPEEWQSHFHEVYWQALAQRPWVWGKFIWNMFDFASDGRNEGSTPGRNDKGLVTYDRKTRKDAFYWYKANWSDEPVLYITSRRFVARTQPTTTVKIYSNAETVELLVNGVSLGKRTGASRIFAWPDVQLAKGENRVEARAVSGGCELEDHCLWTYTPAPAGTEKE